MPLDPQAKETALRHFTTGMAVIGSRGRHGEVNGMTANWVIQISFQPPLVAVAVENEAHTRHLIDASGVFSVNNVRRGPDAEALVETFVKPAERVGNKLAGEEYTTGETGAPLLASALSWVECNVIAAHHHGDHILFVGEVVGAGVNGEGEPFTLAELGWHYGG
jgi:flavin reductase (DIM6/NTAB) family NADH-FMN oxidoreductase RutF